MKFPAPVNVRQMFQLFQVYRPEMGIASVINAIDWTGVTPAQIYASLLGRLPENRDVASQEANYSPSNHFIEMIDSTEFQQNLIQNFVKAFPEKPRVVFIHIPKCGGTDLTLDLCERFASLPFELTIPERTAKNDLRRAISSLSGEIQFSSAIFLSGHIPLKWYIDHEIIRFGDRVFTIVRNPVHIILSKVNYILTELFKDPQCIRQDVKSWIDAMGETRLPEQISEEDCLDYARLILHSPSLVGNNYLCSYLGNGNLESTLDPIAQSNIEVVDFGRYVEWRQSAWGLTKGLHRNRSSPILTEERLTAKDWERIMDLTAEDSRLYSVISEMVLETDAQSVCGLDLVHRMTQ